MLSFKFWHSSKENNDLGKAPKKWSLRRIAFILTIILLLAGVAFLYFGIHIEKFIKYEIKYRSILKNIHEPTFPNETCNILDFGAVADGATINTGAIRDAMDACSQKGGGTVEIPEGRFLTGPIHFQSNINLHLEKAAELVFSDDRNQYLPPVFSRFQGMEYFNYSPMVYGKDVFNVAITGEGRLVGNSKRWIKWGTDMDENPGRQKLVDMVKNDVPVVERIFGEEEGLRPSFIQFISSKNILLDGITIADSPMWTVHPIYSDNIIIRKVTISNNAINTDGIVIDSSRNVLIEDSSISSGDDAISLKSGLEKDGWRVAKPTENVVIRNITIKEGHAGLSIGSEMSGDVRSVILRDSIFNNTDTGLNVKSLPGRGGTVEDVWLYHLTFVPVEIGIKLNMDYDSAVKDNSQQLPLFRNFLISRIRMHASNESLFVQGLGGSSLSGIDVVNLRSNSQKTFIKDAEDIDISFSNI